MKKEAEAAITTMLKNVGKASDSHDAMRYSQSVLNLAHVLATIVNAQRTERG